MARNAIGAKALQLFRGGLNKLSLWAQHIGGACCDPAPAITIDRLNPTINPENALTHTRPIGFRDTWRFGDHADSERDAIVRHLNEKGVGAQLEVLVIPTFAFLQAVHVVTLAEETGLAFTLKTRNGLVLPTGQQLVVTEADATDGCGDVTRVVDDAPVAPYTGIGALADGISRQHVFGVADDGGSFALEADVLILEVTALPVGGVKGFFDLRVHASYAGYGRSEAAR